MMYPKIYMILICSAQLLSAQSEGSTSSAVADWKPLFGEMVQKEFMGRKAMYLSKGLAYLPNSSFSNGTIEVDIAPVFPGLTGLAFHIDEHFNYNETYIRYAKSGGPDALQYSAVWNGEFSWQLYPEYQANVKYPPNVWVHLKIIIHDTRAAVYVMNADTAALLIDSLRVPNKSGHVGFWTLAPTYFSNFSFTPANSNQTISSIIFKRKIIDNQFAIKKWFVSEPVEYSLERENTLDEKKIGKLIWNASVTEPDGLLNICKYAKKKIWGRTRDNSYDVVWLKYEWEESNSGVKPFSFDYVNQCAVFVNGQKIFSGNNAFLLKGSLYRGDIDKLMRGNTLHLPVKKGKNSLMIMVSHVTNGWGFLGQFADASAHK